MTPGRVRKALLSLVIGAAALRPAAVVAQERHDSLTPRALSDSTYAARIALDAFAEAIRQGRLADGPSVEPQLATAVAGLAAVRRGLRPPHPALGLLWDLRIDVASFEPSGPTGLVAIASVYLATEGDSAMGHVRFSFERHASRWALVAHEGLVDRLLALTTQLRGGNRP